MDFLTQRTHEDLIEKEALSVFSSDFRDLHVKIFPVNC